MLPAENPLPWILTAIPAGSYEDVRDMRGLISWAFVTKGFKSGKMEEKTRPNSHTLKMLKGGFLLFISPSLNFLSV